MNLGWKLLLAVIVIGILLPFTLLKNDSGSTLIKFSELKWPDWDRVLEKLPSTKESSGLGTGAEATIYQWVDAEGNRQFSNSPPPEGVDYSVKIYHPNLNVIQSVDVDNGELESELSLEEAPVYEEPASPYSADEIKKLFEKTKDVEKLLNQRYQNQEAILGQ